MTIKQTVKSFTNLELTKPGRLHPREWHGDIGYSFDGVFFTHIILIGLSDEEVIEAAENVIGLKLTENQIIRRK